MMTSEKTWASIAEVRAANAAAGHHWFEPATMRFFRGRVESEIIGGRYFISSEQFEDSHGNRDARRYTIRVAKADGSIDTVGDFQAYATREAAYIEAKALAQG